MSATDAPSSVPDQLVADMACRPELFSWLGGLDGKELERWVERLGCEVPADVTALWARFGGGELFESETVLSPLADQAEGPIARRLALREQLPFDAALVFHEGLWLTVVTLTGDLQIVRPATAPREAVSVAEWYSELRGEFGARYGLEP